MKEGKRKEETGVAPGSSRGDSQEDSARAVGCCTSHGFGDSHCVGFQEVVTKSYSLESETKIIFGK